MNKIWIKNKRFFFQKVLTWTLVLSFLCPPSIFAGPSPKGPNKDSKKGLQSVGVQSFLKKIKNTLSSSLSSHGRDLIDPYHILGQAIEVVNVKKQTSQWYSFFDTNAHYRNPGIFDLKDDVDVSIASDQKTVVFELSRKDGIPLPKIYRHVFSLPGIKKVIKTSHQVYFLFQNGVIKSLLMPHVELFKANELALGAPALLLPIGVVPRDLFKKEKTSQKAQVEPLHIQDEASIRFYESTQKQSLVFSKKNYPVSLSDLRAGDLLIGKETASGTLDVQEIIPLPEIIHLELEHIAFFARREALLSKPERFVKTSAEGLKGFDGTALSIFKGTFQKKFFSGKNPQEAMLHMPMLSRVFQKTREEWKQHPFEVRGFWTPKLSEYKSYLETTLSYLKDPKKRATYFYAQKEELEVEENTLEARIQKRVLEAKKEGEALSGKQMRFQTLLGYLSLPLKIRLS